MLGNVFKKSIRVTVVITCVERSVYWYSLTYTLKLACNYTISDGMRISKIAHKKCTRTRDAVLEF